MVAARADSLGVSVASGGWRKGGLNGMGVSEWAAVIAWSSESCNQTRVRVGRSLSPAQLTRGLEGLQTEPRASPKPQQ